MQMALVLDSNRKPLMPCHPARARELLCQGKAAVFRRFPFTIILTVRDGGEVQSVELRLVPGSKSTVVALVVEGLRGKMVVWAWEVNHRHRGQAIKDALLSQRQLRRESRNRNTRYLAPRFDNRTRPQGWLAPSLRSRIDNCMAWAKRLQKVVPISTVAVETARFDTQAVLNPKISGVECQQGELAEYEVREYLLEKFGKKCVYCGKKNIPLQIEQVLLQVQGGSGRVSNLVIACSECKTVKGNLDVCEFLAGKPEVLWKLLTQFAPPLKDAATNEVG
jgi:5-methylcytosine-specific restriction endonuclease McrA